MSVLVRIAAIVLFMPSLAMAAASNYPLESIETDHGDLPSLQRGAALFANYCAGCHGLQYQRHIRTADDLGIPHDLYLENLIFDDSEIGSHMTSSMPEEASKAWFGAPPPDLTMATRVRSPEWVYTYLKTFYVDPSRPFGVNNEVLSNAGMPHALIELQGVPVKHCDEDGHDCTIEVKEGTGSMSAGEYDAAVADLVNFLDYTGEPYKADRQRIGVYVLLFLIVLFVFTWLLGREYGKEVH